MTDLAENIALKIPPLVPKARPRACLGVPGLLSIILHPWPHLARKVHCRVYVINWACGAHDRETVLV